MKTLFVIGAGTMGGGIAQVAALHGFTVYLYDIKQEFVDKGLKGIARSLGQSCGAGQDAAGDRDTALPRIIGTLDMQDAANVDVSSSCRGESGRQAFHFSEAERYRFP